MTDVCPHKKRTWQRQPRHHAKPKKAYGSNYLS